ncbi:hypothetical protein [Sinorhizobium fredii]|uniref:hypothetical protein n=1 Tax=Rhizobium fredii TaxID=380 RepID=UPI0012FE7D52|nr:hypothetical protein [Sinorhizobium fredii]
MEDIKNSFLLRFAIAIIPSFILVYFVIPSNFLGGVEINFAYHSGNYAPAIFFGIVAGWLAYKWEAFVHTSFWLIILTMLIFNDYHRDGHLYDREFHTRIAFGACFALVFLTLIIKHHWKNKQAASFGDVQQARETDGKFGENKKPE